MLTANKQFYPKAIISGLFEQYVRLEQLNQIPRKEKSKIKHAAKRKRNIEMRKEATLSGIWEWQKQEEEKSIFFY